MILGHAQFSTTMQIYTHVDEEARNEALAGLNELLNSRRLISALRSEMVVSGLGSVDRANETPGGAKGGAKGVQPQDMRMGCLKT
jgi:hypothetical protein